MPAGAGWPPASIEATVAAMGEPGDRLMAWLGPAIGPQAFEVGGEVRELFLAGDAAAADAFVPAAGGKWMCDIYRWRACACRRSGFAVSPAPTFARSSDAQRWFSHRRDGVSGRMASLVWLE
jgi:copper oxidase (laccase) domain-containing protein